MIFRGLLISFLVLLQTNSFSDPFTNEIGIIKKPEVVEIIPEKISEPEPDLVVENETVEENTNIDLPSEIEQVVEAEPQNTEIVTVLNIDPMVAYPLKDYLLKGVALSKQSEHKFKRAKIRKFDRAKTPTTHTISENETIEKIAFRYGFSLKEMELANAIYPGSRKLVVGDKLVVPRRFHIVKEGQNLITIAEKYNLSSTQLASYNDLDEESIILIGDRLFLPFFIHVTNNKETISEIAERYEREINELMEFNNFEKNTIVLNENQLIKIPIYANPNISYENLSKKSINDFKIDRKNLAIVEINSGQFMVREGDRVGNKDGIIVSIERTRIIVLEDNIEYEFLINTPIAGITIASLPQSTTENTINNNIDNVNNENQTENNNTTNNNNNDNVENEIETDIGDLFN